jgi:hypothetical protein
MGVYLDTGEDRTDMKAQVHAALAAAAIVVAGCAGSGATFSPPATATPVPPSPPSPTVSPGPTADDEFTLDVLPVEEPLEARVAIPGEKVSFLVTLASESPATTPVQISAAATGGKVTTIRSAQLTPGAVGEVWVVPDATDVDATVAVKITGTRGGVTHAVDRTIKVMPMADERSHDAQPYFDKWVAYLIASHPELGITAATTWEPTFVSIFLVVSHYAYYTEDWEMEIAWHNMIPPDDWTVVYLRHRDTETKPSLAWKIDSVSGETEPHPDTPPDAVMR